MRRGPFFVVLFICMAAAFSIEPEKEFAEQLSVADRSAEACILGNQEHEVREEDATIYTAEDNLSWAIKHEALRYEYHQRQYDRFMRECRKASSYCKGKELLRLYMNQHQPRSVFNFTENGFLKRRTPPELWELINNFYQRNKGEEVIEWGKTINPYHNTWDAETEIIRLDNATLGGGEDLHTKISRATRAVLEDWTNQKLAPVSVYGIRIYKNDSILSPHVDRMPLVTSCIINVDQDVDVDWPLEVFGHDGKAYNVTMERGDMVLYESHSVIHGRPFPLQGRFYANVFLHFEPVGPLGSGELGPNENGMPPYIIPGSIWEDEWKLSNPNGWELLRDPLKAVRGGDLRTLELIANVRPEGLLEKDELGWAPIHEAVRFGRLDALKFLVGHGASANEKTGLPGGDKAEKRIPIELALELLGPDHEVTKYLWTVTQL